MEVAGSMDSSTHADATDPAAKEVREGKDAEKDRQQAKRLMVPPECRCQLNGGRPCHTRFSVGELMEMRRHYLTLSRKELDIAVLAKLECGIHLTHMTTRKKRKPTERKKHRTDFYHHGYRICNLMFVYLHGFSYKKLKALIIQYKTNGVRTRVHKNLKPKPPEAEIKPKKKKPKAKVKPKAKEPKAKKACLKKEKLPESSKAQCTTLAPCQASTSTPTNPHPPLPLPAPPAQPPYPVSFPINTQMHPTSFMAPTHTHQPPFPQTVGYNVNGAPIFAPHPMTVHNPTPHPHSLVSNPNPPSVEYSSQPGLPNPPLDFSGHRNNTHNMAAFSTAPHPCVTYSVVHSVTF